VFAVAVVSGQEIELGFVVSDRAAFDRDASPTISGNDPVRPSTVLTVGFAACSLLARLPRHSPLAALSALLTRAAAGLRS
jgi:hypothetical protein